MPDGLLMLVFVAMVVLYFVFSAVESMRARGPRPGPQPGRRPGPTPPERARMETFPPAPSRQAPPVEIPDWMKDWETDTRAERRPAEPSPAARRPPDRPDRSRVDSDVRREQRRRDRPDKAVRPAPAVPTPKPPVVDAAVADRARKAPPLPVTEILGSRARVREAFLLMELLRPPLSLRGSNKDN